MNICATHIEAVKRRAAFHAAEYGVILHRMTDRRYTEDEVAEIFRRAAAEQERDRAAHAAGAGAPDSALAPSTGAGMTLGDLEEIAREVGISPDFVARAASSLDRAGRGSVRRYLGLPIGVGRAVSLGRRLSDAEWERLVVDLRQTFDARGRLHEEGSFRQWTNGNLQALLEPTEEGHQLRLRTFNGAAYSWMITGLSTTGFAAVLAVLKMVMGGIGTSAAGVTMIGLIGLVMFGLGAARLPGWARLRARQMEEVAERVGPHDALELPG